MTARWRATTPWWFESKQQARNPRAFMDPGGELELPPRPLTKKLPAGGLPSPRQARQQTAGSQPRGTLEPRGPAQPPS